MDTARYALPDCPRCGGRGIVPFEDRWGVSQFAVCACARFGQRRAAAEAMLPRIFPGRMAEMTLDRFATGDDQLNELALRAARNFVDDWATAHEQGWMIGFYGSPNAGKTHLAVAIAQAVLKRYLAQPEILNVPKMLREERATFRERGQVDSPIDRAMRADLLVLDDLGAEYQRARGDGRSDQDWVDEQIYLILDERVMNRRPVIYTTNIPPAEMAQRLSERVLSRIERARVAQFEVVSVPGKGRVGRDELARLTRLRDEPAGS